MIIKKTSRLLLFLLLALGMSMGLSAQSQKIQKNNSFWIDLTTGVGSESCYDNGTIPYHYGGVAIPVGIGFTDEWKRCHIEFEGQYIRSLIVEPSGNNNAFDARLEFLYSCLKPSESRWHFWSGVNMEGYGEIKSIPVLQNASASFSSFGHIGVVEKLACDFGYTKDRSHHWMTAFFKLTLPIAGVVSRPDFMYVHDPMNTSVLASILSTNEKFFKIFPGATTDLGLTLNLRNGNRISLFYSWDYLTTGKKGAYRYDNAYHTVNLSFMFKL
ncbi:MAG: hypothetical protein J6T59_07785 [Bacteroidales bacterium]|nr:hypothetical protein [Bacteroidales bacterium]